MALITCKDCKRQFSTDAKRCPNCGAKKPVKQWTLKGILTLFVVLFVFGWFSSQRERSKSPEEIKRDAEYKTERTMGYICQDEIKKTLHDPDSADFDDPLTYRVVKDKNTLNIFVTLRAKNGFNALRKMAALCKVSMGDKGDWHVTSVQEIK